ncbi:MAG: Rpn family recombination-promoting nuclease/putative transposase [Planctomycetaceae bacterium]|jgi:predicted transposase YdaD|nr:Rpn family recombination-promoting nuclease/putative transposase [Planctomycetaceae bacterium]
MSKRRIAIQLELNHPHDLLSRRFLFDVELFGNMLEHQEDAKIVRYIDLTSLENTSPTIIDENLQETIGDLHFSAKIKDGSYSKIFVFFEHQSKKILRFWLRILRKLLQFYERYDSDPQNRISDGENYPYPLVVILYHGKNHWEELLQLKDLVSLPEGMNPRVLWFPVILIDLSQKTPEELDKYHPALRALIDSLASYSAGVLEESRERIFGYFKEIKEDSRVYGWTKSLTKYFGTLTLIGEDVLIESISEILNPEGAEEMVKSTIRELYMEGIMEGKIEGLIEGRIKDVLKLLKSRFKRIPAATEKAIQSYRDPIALESLFEQALDCESLAEFERDLAHL